MLSFLTLVGAIAVAYIGVRVVATGVDGLNYWQSRRQARIFSQLAFWRDCEKLVKACQDSGEFPLDDALTIDLSKASSGDLEKLSAIKNPVKALERQLYWLFVTSNVADKMDVRPDNNLLHICSPSW